jgi:hypothetical protein
VFSRPVLIGRGLGKCSCSLWDAQGTAQAVAKAGSKDPASEQFPVTMAAGKHPFPYRTRKLRPSAPMVLGGRPPGRVGRRRNFLIESPRVAGALFVAANGSLISRGLDPDSAYLLSFIWVVQTGVAQPGRSRARGGQQRLVLVDGIDGEAGLARDQRARCVAHAAFLVHVPTRCRDELHRLGPPDRQFECLTAT